MQLLQTMRDLLSSFWPYLLFLVDMTFSIGASAHVVLHKRDTRAAIGWAGIIWLAPILGTILYVLFGVNRIARRAQNLRAGLPQRAAPRGIEVESIDSLRLSLGPQGESLGSLAKLVGEITGRPLLAGNRFEPLINGDQAYPAMIAAIDEALSTISLTTYIFDNDRSGAQFREALARAVQRGVAVRVIVDDVGRRYSWHSITGSLRKAGMTVAKFLPTFVPSHFRYSNLRSHRKILVIDGRVGFTGGMNIRYGHTLAPDCTHPIQDLHFRVEGPVVAQMQETFAIDWAFCTGELLTGDAWFPALEAIGPAYARGVDEGPDDDVEQLLMTWLGALASAQRSVMIVTPYFLPDDAILTAISVAAMRGIEVDVVVPKKNNLRTVGWAMIPTLRLLLDSGCRVWQSAPPFDHSKIVTVDGIWSFVGSANWDARSLRLNFEFNVEAYDRQFAAQLEALVRDKIRASTPLTAADIDGRNLMFKLRDGVARLASPYL
jgi:cardiolipin synthase